MLIAAFLDKAKQQLNPGNRTHDRSPLSERRGGIGQPRFGFVKESKKQGQGPRLNLLFGKTTFQHAPVFQNRLQVKTAKGRGTRLSGSSTLKQERGWRTCQRRSTNGKEEAVAASGAADSIG